MNLRALKANQNERRNSMTLKPRICQTKHNPPESYGDCIRACVATLIDNDDVPHVFDGREPPEAWAALRAFLKTVGKCLAISEVNYEDVFGFMEANNPGVPYMLLCSSGGVDHAIVCRGGYVEHNPAWYKQGIDGPSTNGWIVCVIGDE